MNRFEYLKNENVDSAGFVGLGNKIREWGPSNDDELKRSAKAIIEYLSEEVPELIALTPEQKRAVRWLIEGGYTHVEVDDYTVCAGTSTTTINTFNPAHFVWRCFKDMQIEHDKRIELNSLLEG